MVKYLPQDFSRAAVIVWPVVFSNMAAIFPNVLAVLPKLHMYGEPMAVVPPVYSIYMKDGNGKAAGTCNTKSKYITGYQQSTDCR